MSMTASTDKIAPRDGDDDGFNAIEEVPLWLWLEANPDGHGETIDVVPDPENNEARLYRWINRDKDGRNERLKTTLHNVSFGARLKRDERLTHLCFQGRYAETLLSFLLNVRLLDLDDAQIVLTYWEDNGKGMFDHSSLTEESVYCKLRRERRTIVSSTITSVYGTDLNMVGRFESGLL